MTDIRVIAIPTRTADKVRATLRSPGYGHPAHVEIASGYGPGRHCLQYFDEGVERRILFTYDSFHGIESLPKPGPIFVHAEHCPRYAEDAGFPTHLQSHPLTLTAYAKGRSFRDEQHVTGADAEPALRLILMRPDVDYVLASDTDAGCYDFRVERARSASVQEDAEPVI